MKTKLRRFTAVLSAILCMICCVLSAVPAFALTNSDLPTGGYNPKFNERYKTAIAELKSKYPDKFKNYVMMLPYYDSSFDQIGFYWFSCDDSNNFEVYEKNNSYYIKNTDSKPFTSYRIFLNTRTSLFTDLYVNGTSSTDNFDYALSWQIYDSNCNVKFGDKYEFGKSDAPVTPFTVSYSPLLVKNMSRTGKLIAPGASNDGATVESNSISVTVSLTDDFIKASKIISGNFVYSYQFTCFVVPSEYKDSDIKTMSENAVYTGAQDNQNYLYYEDETLDVGEDYSDENATGEITPVSEQWANATGISNCFVLKRENDNIAKKVVTIDLHNIDFASLNSDSYNIVVLGHIVRKSEYGWTSYPSYFKSTCSSLTRENTSTFPMNFKTDEEPATEKVFYEYYTVVSDDWSYTDYPEYEPHKVGNTTIGNNPLDFTNTASGVQDYDMWSEGGNNNTLPPDEFDKYKEDKILSEQANSFKFDVDGLKDIFSQEGNFFEFLTASISVLPGAFLTILLAFFGVMLAICLVKWLL